MILFPGSYIRFNPQRNRSLKNADLFRTILSLKESENEVFEFINPRVKVGDKDIFFNYRLRNAKKLFQILSMRSREKVDDAKNRKGYLSTSNSYGEDDSSWLINPSKKNHNMLLELSNLLYQVIER
jgi:bisphosphoglycerate-independent phosphoglycerate mutase (AlkP superfamily)